MLYGLALGGDRKEHRPTVTLYSFCHKFRQKTVLKQSRLLLQMVHCPARTFLEDPYCKCLQDELVSPSGRYFKVRIL